MTTLGVSSPRECGIVGKTTKNIALSALCNTHKTLPQWLTLPALGLPKGKGPSTMTTPSALDMCNTHKTLPQWLRYTSRA